MENPRVVGSILRPSTEISPHCLCNPIYPVIADAGLCGKARSVRNRRVDLLGGRIKPVYLTRIFAIMNG